MILSGPAGGRSTERRRILFALLAIACFTAVLLLPLPPAIEREDGAIALTRQGKASLAVLCLVVVLWITEALPFAVTGLAAIVALVMTKAGPLTQLVRDGFGNPIILFFIGVLILSAAISRTTLMKRLTMTMLRRFGRRPRLIVLVFLTAGALLSGWITDMAVAAVLTPIALGLLRDAGIEPGQGRFGKVLMISCAWGPLVGGISTPAGCGPNPLTMGFLRDLAGIELRFLDWMILGFPAMLLMIPCAWAVLLLTFPIEKIDLSAAGGSSRREPRTSAGIEGSNETHGGTRAHGTGSTAWKEVVTVAVFLITVFLWVFAPWIEGWTGGVVDYLDISFVAVACSVLLFLPGMRVLTWRQAEEFINWGGIVLIATGLAVGMTVYETGAAEWLAWVLFARIGALGLAVRIFAVVLGVSLLKVVFSSNTVTGIIVVPLLIALAQNLDLNAASIAIPAGITSSLAFILVTSTPTNVIPYSTGYFSIKDMARAGLLMTVISSACVTLSIWLFGRLSGLVS